MLFPSTLLLLRISLLGSFLSTLHSLSTGNECAYFDSNMGARYDLNDLIRSPEQPSYEVVDGDLPCTTNVVEQNFTYMFNICGAVASGIPSACATLTGLNKAGALQIDTRVLSDPSDDYCFLAGVYGDSTTKVALLDQEDPSKGISVTYFGAYCHTPMVQRKFRIELQCADKLSPIPTSALEYEHCSYTVTMPSVYGCPLECPVADRALCGGNGHCSYDVDKGAARCFCNHGLFPDLFPPVTSSAGYRGSACTERGSEEEELNYSPVLFGLIITLFVIIGLLVVGIYFMIRQMAAFKEDITNYHALRGEESESI